MKCLFTIRSLSGGGAERVVSTMANALAEKGNDVYIVVYKQTDADYKISEQVNIIEMPQRKDSIMTKVKRISDMRSIISKINPDVVIPFVGTVLYVTWLAMYGKKGKFIATVRNNPWLMPESKVQRKFRDYIAKKSDGVLIQNEEQAEYFPISTINKMYVINNPIAPEFLNTKKNTYSKEIKTIITAGRLNYQKNQKLMIKGFAEVCKNREDICLDIYGEGPLKDELNQLIDLLGMNKQISLRGRVKNMESTLSDADLFVMTSDFEGMPNALMEAMAVGVPCISSDCKTGPSSLISSGIDGMLFKVNDQKDFEKKLNWAITHTNEMNTMGQNGRKKMIKNYTMEQIEKSIDDLFDGNDGNR